MSEVSQQVIDQRVRNRLTDQLQWILEYEEDPCYLDDIIKYWDGFAVRPEKRAYSDGVYTTGEIARLVAVNQAMDDFCDSIPHTDEYHLDFPKMFASREWKWLVHCAELAQIELAKRGRFSEDVEEDFSLHCA